jgi:methionyl-tRNA formyltransferase
VAAYGLILPRAILDIPRPRKYRPNACATDCELTCPESRRQPAALLDAPPPVANAKPGQITREVERNNLDGIPPGCINVHASLLPRWRGAAPIQRALLAGDERLGVSIMRMEEGLDTGDFCATASTDGGDKDLAQLTMELGQLGAQALLAVLPDIASGSAVWVSQDQTQATYAEKIAKDELWLSPQLGALDNLRRVRAASEQAPARCLICGKSVTVLAARLGQGILGPALHSPGFQAPVTYRNRQLFLQAADEWLEILELKPDGRQRMSATAFASGVKALQGTDQAAAAWNSL